MMTLASSDDDNRQNEEEARRCVTLELIRKRSEHHEGPLIDLKELDFHQDHLESLGTLLGRTCPNLTALYLHNNVIDALEKREWSRFQYLQRLSLALNNLTKLPQYFGECCPALRHLDVSFNFIPLEKLQDSLEALKPMEQLRELYLKGNPCEREWTSGIHKFVVTQLPQLHRFDGKEVNRDTIIDETDLQQELRQRIERSNREHTAVGPEVRAAMSREWIAMRNENTERERLDHGLDDRSKVPANHAAVVKHTRDQEQAGERRNCNDGDLEYDISYEQSRVVLQVSLPHWIPTEELDLDVQPTYVSLVAQTQVLRLRLPPAILPDECQAQRSQATGRLEILMPLAKELVPPPTDDDTNETRSNESPASLMENMLRDAAGESEVVEGIERIHLGQPSSTARNDDEDDDEPPPMY